MANGLFPSAKGLDTNTYEGFQPASNASLLGDAAPAAKAVLLSMQGNDNTLSLHAS